MTYNHEAFILEAINGVLMQNTEFNVELIIGNDTSTDNSDKVIRDFIESKEHNLSYNHQNCLLMYEYLQYVIYISR